MFEVICVSFAFFFGLALRQIGLPPMVGFLAAGFAINAASRGRSFYLDFLRNPIAERQRAGSMTGNLPMRTGTVPGKSRLARR